MLTTARDMARWHRALAGEAVLSEGAKRTMFTKGYGWAVDRDAVRHSGQSQIGGSAAEIVRYARDGVMAFTATGDVARTGQWNLAELDLAAEAAEAARDA